jgi:hypothetical protein
MMVLKLTRFASRGGSHKVGGEVTLCRRTGLWLNMMSFDSNLCEDKTYSYKSNNFIILCDTLL